MMLGHRWAGLAGWPAAILKLGRSMLGPPWVDPAAGHRWTRLTGWPVAMVTGGPVEVGGLSPYVSLKAIWCAL